MKLLGIIVWVVDYSFKTTGKNSTFWGRYLLLFCSSFCTSPSPCFKWFSCCLTTSAFEQPINSLLYNLVVVLLAYPAEIVCWSHYNNEEAKLGPQITELWVTNRFVSIISRARTLLAFPKTRFRHGAWQIHIILKLGTCLGSSRAWSPMTCMMNSTICSIVAAIKVGLGRLFLLLWDCRIRSCRENAWKERFSGRFGGCGYRVATWFAALVSLFFLSSWPRYSLWYFGSFLKLPDLL